MWRGRYDRFNLDAALQQRELHPLDRERKTREAMSWSALCKLPSSVSLYLRRDCVTAARNAGQPKDVTGERVNMSGKILDRHYDKGSHDEKAERRRDYIKDI